MKRLKTVYIVWILLCIASRCIAAPAENRSYPVDRITGMVYLPAIPEEPTDEGSLVVTGLPVLDICTADGTMPDDDDKAGIMHLFEAGENGQLEQLSVPLSIRLRGNTSRRYPKKSFRISILNEAGEKNKISIAGLRRDDDWILNPMYTDASKIREALAYSLWETMNSCGDAARCSGMAFCEVILNGEYAGLYALQERMDRKQVQADKGTGILYKVDTNVRPEQEKLLVNGKEETCAGMELVFSGSEVDEPWLPAADYIALLEGAEGPCTARLSLQNAVEFTLWAVLTQARDCHYKNQFLHCVWEKEEYVMYRIPWDVNHTFGDYWSGSAEKENYMAYSLAFPAVDDAGVVLLGGGDSAFIQALVNRWTELRAGPIQEEDLLEKANLQFQKLYPAILRDHEKWPESGMGEGNAANIRDIEYFLRENLRAMDRWIDEMREMGEPVKEEDNGADLDRGR